MNETETVVNRMLVIVLAICAAAQLGACSVTPNAPPVPLEEVVTPIKEFPDYLIQPGDELDIRFLTASELNEVVLVRPDGLIVLPYISPISVTGKTPEELDAELTELYSGQLLDPDINVIVRSFGGQKVYVGGQVKKPGVVEFSSPISILEAVIMAGGLTDDADPSETIVIRRGEDNRPFSVKANAPATRVYRLAAADVVYVPRSRIANRNLFVEQYIKELLLFGGFRIGFGYDLTDPTN